MKKVLSLLLLFAMLPSTFACGSREESQQEDSIRQESHQEQNSTEESRQAESNGTEESKEDVFQVPDDWTGPEILRFRTPDNWMQGKKVDQAIHQMGRMFLESRIYTEEIEQKYGYSIDSYTSYEVRKTVNASSLNLYPIKGLQNVNIQDDSQTWVVGYSATVTKSKWVRLPKNGGPDRVETSSKVEGQKETREWNLGDWWILHQEGNVFSMMSCTDYRCIQETKKEYQDNPFAAYPVKEVDVPEAELWEYYGMPHWPDEVQYYEPLQAYLWNDTIVFEYEADTESSDEEAVKKATLELGKLYLEELCSREYDPDMTGKHVKPLKAYYVREYKDLGLVMLENSMDRTVEKLKEEADRTGRLWTYREDIPADYCIITDNADINGPTIKAAENIWIAQYCFLVKTDDPVWGMGEEYLDYREAGLPRLQRAVIIKQGKHYSMVMSPEIISEYEVAVE